MQGWIEQDGRHGHVLVRRGRGLVTAVVQLTADGDDDEGFVRVEIDCERPAGRPRAVRYRVHPVLPGGDPLVVDARRAQAEGLPVEWTVRWVRHDWIPADLPVTSLDLAADATAVLAGLVLVAPAETSVDEEWIALLTDGSGDQP